MLSFILLLGVWAAQGITSNTFLEDQTLEPASDIPERMEDDPSPSILTQAFTQVYFTPDGVGDDYYIVETTDPYSLSSTWGKKINAKDGYYMCSLEVQYSDYIKNTDNSFINGLRIWYCPFASTKGEHYYVNHFRMSEDYLTYPISCRGVNAIYPICGFYWRVNKEDYKTADKVGIMDIGIYCEGGAEPWVYKMSKDAYNDYYYTMIERKGWADYSYWSGYSQYICGFQTQIMPYAGDSKDDIGLAGFKVRLCKWNK